MLMKKCPNCGAEYSDDAVYCKKCGQKLVSTNVCQKCGHPVSVDDAYCEKCGHKIEKEYRCESCGSIISENAKFCEECGAKVTNPVVSVAPCKALSTKSNEDKENIKPNLWNKIIFYVLNVVSIILIILFIVGCFGDITKTKIVSTGSAQIETTVSIEYFFGKAVRDIDEVAQTMRFGEYSSVQRLFLSFEYITWISAILMSIFGLILQIRALYIGIKKQKYNVETKNLFRTTLCVVPYLLMLGILHFAKMKISGGGEFYKAVITYGWGTMMLLVCSIVAVCFGSLLNLFSAIINKRKFINETIISVSKISFFIIMMFAIKSVVSGNYAETVDGTTTTLKGSITTYYFYMQSLSQFSAGTIDAMPAHSIKLLLGPIFTFVGGVFGIVFVSLMHQSDKKFSMIFSMAFAILTLGFVTTGYALALSGVRNMMISIDPYSYEIFKFSGTGIAFMVLIIVSIAASFFKDYNFSKAQAE